jgi:hypothetical protein
MKKEMQKARKNRIRDKTLSKEKNSAMNKHIFKH